MKDLTLCIRGLDKECPKANSCARAVKPNDPDNPYQWYFGGCSDEVDSTEPDYFYFKPKIA